MEERINGTNANSLSQSLKSVFKSIIRFWWVIILIGIVAGLAGIFYASNQDASYESRATFALDDAGGSGVGNLMNLASQFGINVGGGASDIFGGDNIIEILKSRRIIETVLTSVDTFQGKPSTLIQFFIDESDIKKESIKKEISFPVSLPKEKYSYQQDSVLKDYYNLFSKKLIVAHRPDKKLSIYEVRVTTPNEELTKVFTDKLLEKANEFYIELRTKKAKQTLTILEQRVASMKGNLTNSITERANVQDVNINPAFEKAEVPVIKQQANIQTFSAAYAELFKNLEIARFNYLDEIPLMQIIDQPEYPMHKNKLGKLTSALVFAFIAEVIFFLILAIKYVFKN